MFPSAPKNLPTVFVSSHPPILRDNLVMVPAIAKNPPFNNNNVPAAIPRPFRTLSRISSNFLP